MEESKSKYQRWKGIMKAYPFEEKRLLKWKPPFIVQPKYNGVRCRAVPTMTQVDTNYLLLSSEENPIWSTPHINEELTKLHLKSELDGELYCHGMSFEDIVSITSRTVNLHPDYKLIKFHLFDIICNQPQMKRQLIIENLRGISPYIVVAPFWFCSTLDEVLKVYDNLINLGYEGIIVRNVLGPYERKRSTMVMKFKPKQGDSYEIIGYKEEVSISGQPKGSLGSLALVSGDGQTFSVGSGFTEQQRSELWSKREELIGKFANIRYQHMNARHLPMFTVFVSIANEYDEEEKK